MENNENEKKSEALEFDFASSGGLVFETVENAVKNVEVSNEEEPDPESAYEEPTVESTGTSLADDSSEEFRVPESFKVNEKYNTPMRENERTRIYTTYVPRFTEVSETYRMKNDPRPRPRTEPVVSAKTEKTAITYEKSAEVKDAPIPEEKAPVTPRETVVVNVPAPVLADDMVEESFDIFKFPETDLSDNDRMNVEEENANRRALEELKARQAARREREAAEKQAAAEEAERAAREERERTVSVPEDYRMPDPEHTGFVGKAKAFTEADYDKPHGIPIDSEKVRKLKITEYTSAGQRDTFKDRFLDSLVAFKIRLSVVLLLSVAALLFGNFKHFGIDLASFLGIMYLPSAVAVIDLQIVIFSFLLALPEITVALRRLVNGVLTPEAALLVSFVTLVAYDVFTVTFKYVGYPVFGFVFALSVFFVIFSAYLCKKSDFENFKLISVQGEKKVIEHEETRNYARMMLALDGAVDGYKSNTAKNFRTTFVSYFFTNSAKCADKTKNTAIMLGSGVGVALVSAIVVFFTAKTNAFSHAAAAFALVTAFAVSAISYFSRRVTYYHAGKEARFESSAIIGERAYTDAADVDVISFEDTEIFGEDDVNLKRFGFYGNEDNMNRSMRLISSLFANVGGPLHSIFSKTLEKRCTPATDPVIDDDGVSGNVDGKTVLAGTAEYMLRRGIKIPDDNDRAYGGIGSESMKIMYGAEDGVVFAKFYIRYSFSERFTSLLPAIREEGIVPLVYTSDPNISNELLRTLTMGSDCMRVMKRKIPHSLTERIYPRLSADIVTSGDTINSIKIILLAKKYKRFTEALEKAGIITMASGTATLALISAFGFAAAVPTAILGAAQIISALALWLLSRKKFNINKLK